MANSDAPPVEFASYWTPKRAAAATLVVAGVAGSILLVCRFNHVFILLFLAIVLATALKPLVAWLTHRGMRWVFAVGLVFTLIALAVFAGAMFAAPMLVDEAGQFIAQMPDRYGQLRGSLTSSQHTLVRQAGKILPDDLPTALAADPPSGSGFVGEAVPSAATAVLKPALDVTWFALQVLVAAVIVCILSAYWLLQEQRTVQSLLLTFPQERRQDVRSLIGTMEEKVGAYVRGQFVLCLIVGLLSLVGYWLIGLPQALLLAFIAGVLEAVPMLGPVLGAVPALAVALSVDPTKALGVVILVIVIQQLENYLLVPRVMERAVGINGFVTLLAIAAFGTLFGLLGAVLAIPLAAIVQVLVDRYLLGRQVLEPAEPAGRDRSSRLQFELQSLVKDVRMVIRAKPRAVEEGNDSLEEAIEALASEIERELAGDAEEANRTQEPSHAA